MKHLILKFMKSVRVRSGHRSRAGRALLAFLMGLSFTSPSYAVRFKGLDSEYFLTYREFVDLNPEQREKYVEDLQKVFAELGDSSIFFSQNNSSQNLFAALINGTVQPAMAEDDDGMSSDMWKMKSDDAYNKAAMAGLGMLPMMLMSSNASAQARSLASAGDSAGAASAQQTASMYQMMSLMPMLMAGFYAWKGMSYDKKAESEDSGGSGSADRAARQAQKEYKNEFKSWQAGCIESIRGKREASNPTAYCNEGKYKASLRSADESGNKEQTDFIANCMRTQPGVNPETCLTQYNNRSTAAAAPVAAPAVATTQAAAVPAEKPAEKPATPAPTATVAAAPVAQEDLSARYLNKDNQLSAAGIGLAGQAQKILADLYASKLSPTQAQMQVLARQLAVFNSLASKNSQFKAALNQYSLPASADKIKEIFKIGSPTDKSQTKSGNTCVVGGNFFTSDSPSCKTKAQTFFSVFPNDKSTTCDIGIKDPTPDPICKMPAPGLSACKSPNSIACNPLLYGLKPKGVLAKLGDGKRTQSLDECANHPEKCSLFCVAPGGNTEAKCNRGQTGIAEGAAKIIAANPLLWTKFTMQFQQMCSVEAQNASADGQAKSSAFIKDLNQDCQAMQKRLKSINDKYAVLISKDKVGSDCNISEGTVNTTSDALCLLNASVNFDVGSYKAPGKKAKKGTIGSVAPTSK